MGTLSPGEQPLDVTRFDVESASDLLGTWVRHTPVAELERGAFGIPGRLVLKLELLQHTGSFKPRGAFNRILTADIVDTSMSSGCRRPARAPGSSRRSAGTPRPRGRGRP